jgi:hypothetical protein
MAIAIAFKLTNIQWVEGELGIVLAKERIRNFVIPANKAISILLMAAYLLHLFNYVIRLMLKHPEEVLKKMSVYWLIHWQPY